MTNQHVQKDQSYNHSLIQYRYHIAFGDIVNANSFPIVEFNTVLEDQNIQVTNIANI